MNSINKNILFTIAYLSSADFNPTTFEIWRHFIDIKGERKSCSFLEVVEGVECLKEKELVYSRNGFWSLKSGSADDFYRKRILKQKISLAKIKKMIKWNKIFCAIPFLRSTILNGTLAMKNSSQKSDWDILIVTKKNRIWLGRLFLFLSLSFFGKRRSGKKVQDKFCLNHYLTENGLILEEQGIFISLLISFSFWITGEKNAKRFYQVNDFRNQAFLPNFSFDLIVSDKIEKKPEGFKMVSMLENFLEKIRLAEYLNQQIKKMMIWKIKNNPKTNTPGADIRVSDQALIFLPDPKREKFLIKTKKILEKLK